VRFHRIRSGRKRAVLRGDETRLAKRILANVFTIGFSPGTASISLDYDTCSVDDATTLYWLARTVDDRDGVMA